MLTLLQMLIGYATIAGGMSIFAPWWMRAEIRRIHERGLGGMLPEDTEKVATDVSEVVWMRVIIGVAWPIILPVIVYVTVSTRLR